MLVASSILSTLCPAQDIAGDWQGTLIAGSADLRRVLHITKVVDGRLKGSWDSVDQSANDTPMISISLLDSKLKPTSGPIHGSYESKVHQGATAIPGTWSQAQNAQSRLRARHRFSARRGAATRADRDKPSSDSNRSCMPTVSMKVCDFRHFSAI